MHTSEMISTNGQEYFVAYARVLKTREKRKALWIMHMIMNSRRHAEWSLEEKARGSNKSRKLHSSTNGTSSTNYRVPGKALSRFLKPHHDEKSDDVQSRMSSVISP